jgi:hypothetical protein
MKRLLWVGVSVLALVGCAREGAEAGAATTTGAPYGVTSETAIRDVSRARCNREQTCNRVGPERAHETMEACLHEVERDTRATLRDSECPNGIDQAGLSRCLDDIRNERCSNPLDVMSRLASCNRAKVCR